jgi:uncharacterized protein (DUF2164 family)
MFIKLPKDKEIGLIESIKHYFNENMDSKIGDLKAKLLLDYFIQEIDPCIYNQAILDAQSIMTDKVNDLDSSCYFTEFAYWKK